jgi:hypothetical protein
VQPVGADNEIEPARSGSVEGHVHTVAVVAQTNDGVVVEELNVALRSAGQDCRQVAARDLQPVAGLSGDPSDAVASAVDDSQVGHERRGLPQGRKQVHPLDHGQGSAANVDRAAAGAQTS